MAIAAAAPIAKYMVVDVLYGGGGGPPPPGGGPAVTSEMDDKTTNDIRMMYNKAPYFFHSLLRIIFSPS
jgi:hypothetical protein